MEAARRRVLLADGHTLVLQAVSALIDATDDMRVVGQADNGEDALRLALTTRPDLVVLDVVMPQLTGLQVAAEIQHRRVALKILIMSTAKNERFVLEAIRSGAVGFIDKSATAATFLASCRRALRGQRVLYPEHFEALVRRVHPDGVGPRTRKELLTAREEQVVKLIAEGHTGQEIARMLYISPRTVERHRANVLEKLHMPDRVALTRYAIRTGLIEA